MSTQIYLWLIAGANLGSNLPMMPSNYGCLILHAILGRHEPWFCLPLGRISILVRCTSSSHDCAALHAVQAHVISRLLFDQARHDFVCGLLFVGLPQCPGHGRRCDSPGIAWRATASDLFGRASSRVSLCYPCPTSSTSIGRLLNAPAMSGVAFPRRCRTVLAWRLGDRWHHHGRPHFVQAEVPGSLALDAVLRIMILGAGCPWLSGGSSSPPVPPQRRGRGGCFRVYMYSHILCALFSLTAFMLRLAHSRCKRFEP